MPVALSTAPWRGLPTWVKMQSDVEKVSRPNASVSTAPQRGGGFPFTHHELTMSFEDQLKRAIGRGKDKSLQAKAAERARALSQEEIRNLHNKHRLEVCDHIEETLKKVGHHIPGFQYETIYGERGWGGAISRDDIQRGGSFYSRLEITVRPLTEFNLLNVTGKGTIRNRELLNWNYFSEIADVNLALFNEQIDAWVLQYVEKFASE